MSSQIPAWKRLGLKLKYAANDQSSDVITNTERKRKADNYSGPQKKRKASIVSSLTAAETSNNLIPKTDQSISKKSNASSKSSAENTASNNCNGDSVSLTPNTTRRKSVAFTPETKIEDGDSTKQLFNEWAADQQANDPSFNSSSNQAYSTPQPSEIEENVDPSLPEPERRVKRVKPKQKKIAAKSQGAAQIENSKIDPALTYLDQYCNSKSTWKFNKIHQITLLKSLFDLQLIPSDRIEQLYLYIRGLKGHARKVLRDSAMAIKVEDLKQGKENFSKMNHLAKVEQAYETDLKEYVATMTAATVHPDIGYEEAVILRLGDNAIKSRMAKRMRSERILVEMIQDVEDETASKPNVIEIEDTMLADKRVRLDSGKPVRKRKQRTAVIEDDDSTSSSGSEDESEEEDHIKSSDRRKTGQPDDDMSSRSEGSTGSEEGSDDGKDNSRNSEYDTSSEDK